MSLKTIKMPDELLGKLSKLGKNTDMIAEKVLQAGGEVMIKKIRENLSSVVGSGTKYKSRSTEELEDSLGIAPMDIDKDGNYNIKIGFNEPRRIQYEAKGKRSYNTATNAMVANVLEYGKHGQPAKPFLKPAISSSRSQCKKAMIDTFNEEIKKL